MPQHPEQSASGRLAGKTALVTGAAQGVGSAHIRRMAEEGAAIIAIDRQPLDSPAFTDSIAQVKAGGGRIFAASADVTDLAALEAIVTQGAEMFGGIDVLVANAGIFPAPRPMMELPPEDWAVTLAVNLTGAWNTVRAGLPHMRKSGKGGSIVFTSSVYGFKGVVAGAHYAASKHGLVGLMRSLALELGPESIRVNSVHPTTVDTPMVRSVLPEGSTEAERAAVLEGFNVLPVPWVDPVDVSNAVIFLASDEGRFITGAALPVDAGVALK